MKKILFSASTEMLSVENKKELDRNVVEHIVITQNDFKDLKEKYDIEAWVVNPCPNFTIDSSVLEFLPNLKLVCTPTTGTTHLDMTDLNQNGIKVIGLKGSSVVEKIKASSEFTFIHVLNSIRNFSKAIDHSRHGNWRNGDSELRGREICETTIGILGLGRIGGNVAKWSKCMGMKVNYVDPNVENHEYNRFPNLLEMVPNIDVLVVAVHLDEVTEGIINKSILNSMPKAAWLINTSRGEVLVEADLIDALKNGTIRGASVDVLSGENNPNFPQSNLLYKYSLSNDNLIITPHVAGLSIDSEAKAQMYAYTQAKIYLNEK